MKNKSDILQLFENAKTTNTYVKICAPMVRYSKLQFRTLVRSYGVDLCFTPMIMADSFCQSSKARENEYTTNTLDTPLIVQFAANKPEDFVGASKLLYPYVDGVDLNCGCPQKWAIKDGYGCALLSKPEVIHGLVREFKNNLPSTFSVSVKVRLLKDLKDSIQLCQQLEKCGVSFLTVHGRTQTQKSGDDVNVEALKVINDSLQIPLVANGGIKTLKEADNLYRNVNCLGVMAASGILTNPALFTGEEITPLQLVNDWIKLCLKKRNTITFQCYHHHLVFMLEKVLSKKQKQTFNYLDTFEKVDEFLFSYLLHESNYDYTLADNEEVIIQYPLDIVEQYSARKCPRCLERKCVCESVNIYNYNKSDGKYFSSLLEDSSELDFMDSSMFIES